MARSQTKLQYIEDDYSRKTCYRKRKKSLLKKLQEITTLCGIPACAIIYSQYDKVPEVWPNHDEARELVQKFRGLPEMDRTKKMMNREDLLRQQISKLSDQIVRVQISNREKELQQIMYGCLTGASFKGMKLCDALDLHQLVGKTLRGINGLLKINPEDGLVSSLSPSMPSGRPLSVEPAVDDQLESEMGIVDPVFGAINPMQMQPWMMHDYQVDGIMGFEGINNIRHISFVDANYVGSSGFAGPSNVAGPSSVTGPSGHARPSNGFSYGEPSFPDEFFYQEN